MDELWHVQKYIPYFPGWLESAVMCSTFSHVFKKEKKREKEKKNLQGHALMKKYEEMMWQVFSLRTKIRNKIPHYFQNFIQVFT